MKQGSSDADVIERVRAVRAQVDEWARLNSPTPGDGVEPEEPAFHEAYSTVARLLREALDDL